MFGRSTVYWYRGIRCGTCKKMIALNELAESDEEPQADVARLISFSVVCPHCSQDLTYGGHDLVVFGSESQVKPEWKM